MCSHIHKLKHKDNKLQTARETQSFFWIAPLFSQNSNEAITTFTHPSLCPHTVCIWFLLLLPPILGPLHFLTIFLHLLFLTVLLFVSKFYLKSFPHLSSLHLSPVLTVRMIFPFMLCVPASGFLVSVSGLKATVTEVHRLLLMVS